MKPLAVIFAICLFVIFYQLPDAFPVKNIAIDSPITKIDQSLQSQASTFSRSTKLTKGFVNRLDKVQHLDYQEVKEMSQQVFEHAKEKVNALFAPQHQHKPKTQLTLL